MKIRNSISYQIITKNGELDTPRAIIRQIGRDDQS